MPGETTLAKKKLYFDKLASLFDEYDKILIVGSLNVGSFHLQKIRGALRGKAVVLMGKNTMIRKCIAGQIAKHPELESLVPFVKGNIGFVFTKSDLPQVRDKLLEYRVEAPAKAGIVAPNDVVVPAGPTGMEPTQTSFLQALNIASKIVKGQVEIINDVHLIKKGEKVGSSQAALVNKLGLKPFSYGLTVQNVYDSGSVYSAEVLNLTDSDVTNAFLEGVRNVASISMEIGYPTIASLPHAIADAYKRVLAVALETEYSFPKADEFKAILANPGAFAAAAPTPAAGSGAAPAAAAPAAAVEEKKKSSSSEHGDLGGGLFGGDDGL